MLARPDPHPQLRHSLDCLYTPLRVCFSRERGRVRGEAVPNGRGGDGLAGRGTGNARERGGRTRSQRGERADARPVRAVLSDDPDGRIGA